MRWDYGMHGVTLPLQVIPYEPPTDWPGVGFLLRVPQVVVIILDIYYALASDQFQPATNSSNNYVFSHSYTRDEYFRILGVMDEVKSRIESIRAGRTFVTNVDWNILGIYPVTNHDINGVPIVGYNAIPLAPAPYATFEPRMKAIVAPRESYPRHIKTNLLCIHIADNPGDFEFPPIVNPFVGGYTLDQSSAAMNSDPALNSDIDVMKSEYGKFPSYEAWLYGTYTWTDIPNPLPDHPSFEQLNSFIEAVGRRFYQYIADQLSDFGYTYRGESQLVTTDGLLQDIAAHFQYDPDTGVEIGG